MRGPNAERESYWREIMTRQAESGLNGAQFCQRESLSSPSFYSWKRKLRERDAGGELNGTENSGASTRSRFVPVQIEPNGFDSMRSTIRIHWPRGIQLEVPLTAGRDTIDQLFRSLSQIAPLASEHRG